MNDDQENQDSRLSFTEKFSRVLAAGSVVALASMLYLAYNSNTRLDEAKARYFDSKHSTELVAFESRLKEDSFLNESIPISLDDIIPHSGVQVGAVDNEKAVSSLLNDPLLKDYNLTTHVEGVRTLVIAEVPQGKTLVESLEHIRSIGFKDAWKRDTWYTQVQLEQIVDINANAYDSVDSKLIWSVIGRESSGRQYANSSTGARGHMQLMPKTAIEMAYRMGDTTKEVFDKYKNIKIRSSKDRKADEEKIRIAFLDETGIDIRDAKTNITLGTFYLNRLQTVYNFGLRDALVAYNAGPGNVQRNKAPQSAFDYADDIIARTKVAQK